MNKIPLGVRPYIYGIQQKDSNSVNLENESNPVHPTILLSVKMNEVRISSNLVQKHLLKNTDYTKFSTKIL